MKFFRYLLYVLRHKWFVFVECCRMGMPFRGVWHDMSKFRLSEFIPYKNHFGGGIQTGRDKTGYYKPTDTGDLKFEVAWFLHQRRNAHHWQYWTVAKENGRFKVYEMPDWARKEMIADWKGAGKAQGTVGVLEWYTKNRKNLHLGTETRVLVEKELGYVKEARKNG